MPTIIYKPDFVRVTAQPHEPIIELNFALQSMMDWLVGRGVWRFKIEREQTVDKSCILIGEAKVTPGALRFSNFATVQEALKEGIIPCDIKREERYDCSWKEPPIVTGQHRLRPAHYLSESHDHVIINHDLRLDISLGQLNLVNAGLITGFLARGVRLIKCQWSQKRQEMQVSRHGMDRKQFLEYLALNEMGQQLYSWDAPISTLS